MYIIYKHTCVPTGKSYIGVSSKTIDERWQRQVSDAEKKRPKSKDITRSKRFKPDTFKGALQLHGPDTWIHEVLAMYDNPIDALWGEQEFIKLHNTVVPNGYNATIGGELTLVQHMRIDEFHAASSWSR